MESRKFWDIEGGEGIRKFIFRLMWGVILEDNLRGKKHDERIWGFGIGFKNLKGRIWIKIENLKYWICWKNKFAILYTFSILTNIATTGLSKSVTWSTTEEQLTCELPGLEVHQFFCFTYLWWVRLVNELWCLELKPKLPNWSTSGHFSKHSSGTKEFCLTSFLKIS